jgi:lysyl-tRNA synthetase class 2
MTSSFGPEASWRPAADAMALRARARLYAEIRRFFSAAGVLEVETPIAAPSATPDPALTSLSTTWSGSGGARQRLWLHTSPELPMKRLLAAGSGPIYQICKVFRDNERGRVHHPEFSLLEWYRPGWEHRRLMAEVAELVRHVLGRPDLPAEVLTYRHLFQSRIGLDPFRVSPRTLMEAAREKGVSGAEALVLDRDGWLDLLLTHCIEAGLGQGRLTFVCDYPPGQAALARIREGSAPVAERFELYLGGMELANGFHELTDADEQRRRFESDLAERRSAGRETLPLDERFLAALESGMPDASGVALGLDRLLMVMTGAARIDEVLAFPIERA